MKNPRRLLLPPLRHAASALAAIDRHAPGRRLDTLAGADQQARQKWEVTYQDPGADARDALLARRRRGAARPGRPG